MEGWPSIADFGPVCLFPVWGSYFDKNLQSTIEFRKAKAVRWTQCCCSGQPHSCGKPFILPSLSRANAEEHQNPGPLPLTWQPREQGLYVKTRAHCQLGSISPTVHSLHRESLPKDAFKKHLVLPQFLVYCCSRKHFGNLNFEKASPGSVSYVDNPLTDVELGTPSLHFFYQFYNHAHHSARCQAVPYITVLSHGWGRGRQQTPGFIYCAFLTKGPFIC